MLPLADITPLDALSTALPTMKSYELVLVNISSYEQVLDCKSYKSIVYEKLKSS